MYSPATGSEELEDRRGEEQVSLAWRAGRAREFVDLQPEFEVAIDRFTTWLARLEDDDE